MNHDESIRVGTNGKGTFVTAKKYVGKTSEGPVISVCLVVPNVAVWYLICPFSLTLESKKAFSPPEFPGYLQDSVLVSTVLRGNKCVSKFAVDAIRVLDL